MVELFLDWEYDAQRRGVIILAIGDFPDFWLGHAEKKRDCVSWWDLKSDDGGDLVHHSIADHGHSVCGPL